MIILNLFHIFVIKYNEMDKYLKLTLKVDLIDDGKVRFELLFVCKEIHESQYSVLFQSRTGYVFEKLNYFKYKLNRILLPYKIERNRQYVDILDFKNDNNRRYILKKLSKDLIEFSKSDVFYNKEKSKFLSNTLKMNKNYWFLY